MREKIAHKLEGSFGALYPYSPTLWLNLADALIELIFKDIDKRAEEWHGYAYDNKTGTKPKFSDFLKEEGVL